MTERHRHRAAVTRDDEAGLAALADGAHDSELEARVAGDPALAAALERQRAALGMLAAAAVPAPQALRERLATLTPEPARGPSLLRRLVPATAVAAAAVAVALALLPRGGPVVDDVLAAGLRPATAPAHAAAPVDGIPFPRYARWRAIGTRTDVIDGRPSRTVFYARGRARIAYTIVARPAVEPTPHLHAVEAPAGRAAITWTRRGRTCLIVATGLDPQALAALAVW
jgi:hypothetical protein